MNIRWNGNEEIIYMTQERIDSSNAPEVKNELLKLINEKNLKILTIDMSDTYFITSAGLAALLIIKKRALKRDIRMRFKNIPSLVLDIIDITGFDMIFELYNPK